MTATTAPAEVLERLADADHRLSLAATAADDSIDTADLVWIARWLYEAVHATRILSAGATGAAAAIVATDLRNAAHRLAVVVTDAHAYVAEHGFLGAPDDNSLDMLDPLPDRPDDFAEGIAGVIAAAANADPADEILADTARLAAAVDDLIGEDRDDKPEPDEGTAAVLAACRTLADRALPLAMHG